MLLQLFIKNIALIDQIELSFGKGLHVMTGETGAGKSIVVDAMSLILGGRADRRTGCRHMSSTRTKARLRFRVRSIKTAAAYAASRAWVCR